MPKFYSIFCIVLVLGLAYASARGVVYSAFLTGAGTASKAASHYHK